MQILDDEQQGTLRQPPLEDGADAIEDLPPQLLRLDVPQSAIGIAETEDMQKERQKSLDLLLRQIERAEPRCQQLARPVEIVPLANAVGAAHDRAERAIGLFAEGRAGGFADGEALKLGGIAGYRDEFIDQPRLADARFADQTDKLRSTAAGKIEACQQPRQLRIPSDHRRLKAETFESARRMRRFRQPCQPVDKDVAAFATQRLRAETLEGKGMAGEAIGQRPDKNIVFTGHGLQALGGVYRVAGHRIGFCTDRAEAAGDDRAAIDADMQTQRHAGAGAPALADLRRPTDHIECGTKCPDGIVLMSDRRAEQRQQRIADELVDEAAIGFDCLGHLFEQFVLQHPHDFRVDLLAQRREAAEIGKEHGHRPPVGIVV